MAPSLLVVAVLIGFATHTYKARRREGKHLQSSTSMEVGSGGLEVGSTKRSEGGPPHGTNCPDDKWVDEMVRIDPSPSKTILNIGCNKGNDAVRWMEIFDTSPNNFWKQDRWISSVDAAVLSAEGRGYVCKPSNGYVTAAQVETRTNEEGGPTVVCVEPAPQTFQLLHNTSVALGYAANSKYGSLKLVQAAMTSSAVPGEMLPFPNVAAGIEAGSLRGEEGQSTVDVPAKTVDGLVEELKLQTPDVMLIDTEGYDAEVLKGAKKTLAKVRYLEFEVHRDLYPWSKTQLKTVVDELDGQDFDCFWAGNNAKLTHIKKSWNDDFERPVWANVACVKRGDKWAAALEKFSS
eukprot:TRINITY_DN8014_c0_g3_i1.p1 TRINITY_DN8014_c0_g3~~TRINITY_DN8014_c0_g3_i1.p1  ORF type:complete len:371 (+),score=40.72 TRINITY_DN8014_c0_g3_i1:71-1114(+)